ncbi:MFS general substrate transporter [Stemphylium lycopersici]|uniref:MFS general substrate transporter n=1 Tax=Stemphylium lycopersici TaxID=183478 RepID=A0A364N5T1_STELY|nr:MFS general substrate transporter [Stemphylium lycopersici]
MTQSANVRAPRMVARKLSATPQHHLSARAHQHDFLPIRQQTAPAHVFPFHMRFPSFPNFVRAFHTLTNTTSAFVRSNPSSIGRTIHSTPQRAVIYRSMPNIPFLGALFGSSSSMADNTNYPVQKPEGEWQAQLSPEQFRILRKKGTEPPGSGTYDKHYPDAGVYTCGGCDAPLYKANHKFDSGCGWPAFWDAVPGAVGQKPDPGLGMMRTEIQRDSAQHSTLCSTFKDFQQHPSPNHFRSIYFPVDESFPRFIWLRILGNRGFHVVDIDDLPQYVPGQSYGGIMTSTHHGIKPEREYTSLMVVEYDQNMFDNCQPVNNCLLDLIGPVAQRWRGGIIRRIGNDFSHGFLDFFLFGRQVVPTTVLTLAKLMTSNFGIRDEASTSKPYSNQGTTHTTLSASPAERDPESNTDATHFVADDKYSTSSSNSADDEEGITHGKSRRRSRDLFINTEGGGADTTLPPTDETEQTEVANKPVSWSSLPRKDQLLVLALARLSEPLTQTSLGSYLYYQLQSFDPSLSEATISYQAGIIGATFPATQFVTAMLWGRFSDSEYGGRKRTIYLGLVGTMLSTIGFGFSNSFAMAVFFRCLGGVLNGNIGVMRTMISEIIKEKKYQSRAFLVLPMTFNIGVLIGPILGGLLADPIASYPSLFGPNSTFGGREGVRWMKRYPYALPNLTSAAFLCLSSLAVLFFLEETTELCKHRTDLGLRAGRWIRRKILRQNLVPEGGYKAVPVDDLELQQTPTSAHPRDTTEYDRPRRLLRQQLPFRRIWTWNLIATLCAHGILAMHVGTFNGLWTLQLSTPRFDPSHPYPPEFKPHGLFFTGGLAMPPARIGISLAIIGVIGLPLQLFVYPKLSHRLGIAKCYRVFLALFPLMYTIAPFLTLVPSWTAPPNGVTGPWIWIAMTCALSIQVLARTFALPCTAILINNASPHPSVLGTVHGIGQSVSSFMRTLGPILFSWLFGKGLDIGMVGLSWWCVAAVAVGGWVLAQGVREGDGHEILLEGEKKDEN